MAGITGADPDVRRALVAEQLSGDEDYAIARRGYRESRDRYRLVVLEIERLKLLATLAAGTPGEPALDVGA